MLVLTLGAFFIVLGITGVFKELGESIFSLSSRYSTLEVVFGIAELVCGILLFVGFFVMSDKRPVFWGGLIVLVFWIIRIALTRFVWGLTFIKNGTIHIPNFMSWLLVLCCELVISAALLAVVRSND